MFMRVKSETTNFNFKKELILNVNHSTSQDRFKDWESSGVKIVPVLSLPDDNWNGESGYVQVIIVCGFNYFYFLTFGIADFIV